MVGMGGERERERCITKHIKEGKSQKEVDVSRGKKEKESNNESDFMSI